MQMIGDHPDIENALRTGYREGMDLSFETCPGCQGESSNGDFVLTGCGLKVCRDCIGLCDGCEAKVGCNLCGD